LNLLNRIIKKLALRIAPYQRKAKRWMGIDTYCQYKQFKIALPADHMLPIYQRVHPQYDRFLPHLAKYLPKHTTVIDVGANCGDTLAAMFDSNKNLHYVCIEPDPEFYNYLTRNIAAMNSAVADASIKAVQSLVGKEVTNVSLAGSGGTKKAVFNDTPGSIAARQLDEIILTEQIADISLIKSDVDGFDYDVLRSGWGYITNHKPCLFFECQLDHEFQLQKYQALFKDLWDEGYTHWVVFDNFGAAMLQTASLDNITDLLSYVWQQNRLRSTRTVNYVDVLGFVDRDVDWISSAIKRFEYC
jgi:FkbM family methyltransferase